MGQFGPMRRTGVWVANDDPLVSYSHRSHLFHFVLSGLSANLSDLALAKSEGANSR
jgi:hypothetical protein